MANMHLVTGYAGREHVTAADQAAFHNLFIGGGEFVLDTGNQFAASIVSNNQVRVLDGDIYMQGRFVRLDKDTYIDLAIENGAQGYSRNDLIVARYTENQVSAVEEVNLVVIKGEPAASDPVDPAYTKGDILVAGDMQHDMPLYRVVIDGLEIVELVPLFQYDSDLQLIQKRTNLLQEGVSLVDEDYFPMFDSSERKHKKMPWKNMRKHNHSADEIIEGVLPVERGGTGADTPEKALENLGLSELSFLTKLSPAGTGTLYVYCKDDAGNFVSGCVVQIGEELAVTGSSGAVKYLLDPGTYSVTIRSPIDYGANTQTLSVTVPMSQIVSVDVTILDESEGETVRTFTTGLVTAFSGRVSKADVCAVGGGGSGGMTYRKNDSYPYGAAAGGAGGCVDNVLDMDLSEAFVVSVGLGGAAIAQNDTTGLQSDGKAGGESSVITLSGRNLAKASGGEGGKADNSVYGINGASGGSGSAGINVNGDDRTGPAGEDGSDGATVTDANGNVRSGGKGQGKTTRAFGEDDGELFSSAGASIASSYSTMVQNDPGTGAGAANGFYSSASASTVEVSAFDATTPGSGGGAVLAIIYSDKSTSKVVMNSGAGANGLVRFRWEVSA